MTTYMLKGTQKIAVNDGAVPEFIAQGWTVDADRNDKLDIVQLIGTGSPEGVQTAVVGSVYTDLNATYGAVQWIKVSGTGNTGWRVNFGDTGWRNIASLLVNGWTATGIAVRRFADLIELRVVGLNAAAATAATFANLPTGLQVSNTQVAVTETVITGAGATRQLGLDAACAITGYAAADVITGTVVGMARRDATNQLWPTAALPGSALS